MELFIVVKCCQGFLRSFSELAVSRTEALKPAFNWVVHWFFGRQMSEHIGLVISDRNKSYHAVIANEYKHVVKPTGTTHHSPPIHIAAVGGPRCRDGERADCGMHTVGANDDIELVF